MNVGHVGFVIILVLFETTSVTTPGEDILVVDLVFGFDFATLRCGKLEAVGIISVSPNLGGIFGVVSELGAETVFVEFKIVNDNLRIGLCGDFTLGEIFVVFEEVTLFRIILHDGAHHITKLIVVEIPTGFTDSGGLPVIFLRPVADSFNVSGLHHHFHSLILYGFTFTFFLTFFLTFFFAFLFFVLRLYGRFRLFTTDETHHYEHRQEKSKYFFHNTKLVKS